MATQSGAPLRPGPRHRHLPGNFSMLQSTCPCAGLRRSVHSQCHTLRLNCACQRLFALPQGPPHARIAVDATEVHGGAAVGAARRDRLDFRSLTPTHLVCSIGQQLRVKRLQSQFEERSLQWPARLLAHARERVGHADKDVCACTVRGSCTSMAAAKLAIEGCWCVRKSAVRGMSSRVKLGSWEGMRPRTQTHEGPAWWSKACNCSHNTIASCWK